MSIALAGLCGLLVIGWVIDRSRYRVALAADAQPLLGPRTPELTPYVPTTRTSDTVTVTYVDSFADDSPRLRAARAAQMVAEKLPIAKTIKTKAATARSRKAKK